MLKTNVSFWETRLAHGGGYLVAIRAHNSFSNHFIEIELQTGAEVCGFNIIYIKGKGKPRGPRRHCWRSR